MYGLQGPDSYAYTSRSNCLTVPGIDDVEDWASTLEAMRVVGIVGEEQEGLIRMLATVLWLGNVEFGEGDDGNAFIKDEGVTSFVAYLMEVEEGVVGKVLTSRVVETQRGGKRGKSCLSILLGSILMTCVQDPCTRCRSTLPKHRQSEMHWPRQSTTTCLTGSSSASTSR